MIQTDTDDVIARIREIGGQLVILDEDLADFYGVSPADLRAVVRRHKDAFKVELVISVVLGGNRGRKLAFTEHGVIVAGMMLQDPGIEALSIHIVRAFVKLREANASHFDVARRIEVLDAAVTALDLRIRRQFSAIYEALGMSVKTTVPGSSTGQKLH